MLLSLLLMLLAALASAAAGVRYDVGDMEIEIEWFQRDISGGDERCIFRAWRRIVDADGKVVDPGPVEGKKYTFNSTELCMINVEMQLVPPVGGVVLDVVRRGGRCPAWCSAGRSAELAGHWEACADAARRPSRAAVGDPSWQRAIGARSVLLVS